MVKWAGWWAERVAAMKVGWIAVNWGGWVGGWILVSLVGRATVTRAGSRAEGEAERRAG